MKIKVDALELRGLLAEMVPFTKRLENDDGLPAAFYTTQSSLVIRTGDYHKNHYCERVIDAQIIKAGESGFELSTCASVLSVVDGEIILEIENGMAGSITNGNTNLAFRGSAEQIWKPEAPKDNWKVIETTKPLVDAAKIANKCRRQDDDVRYAINSICLYEKDIGLELVGTDGILLVSARTGIKSGITEPIVAQPTLAGALSTYIPDEPLSYHISQGAIWLRQGSRTNVIARISGAYPDYGKYVDKHARPVGIIDPPEIKKLQVAINKNVLQPTPQGLLRICAEDNELKVQGKHKGKVLALPMPNAKLAPCAVAADQFARALGLFKEDIEIFHSEKAGTDGHLYLTDEDVFVMLSLKKDFFR